MAESRPSPTRISSSLDSRGIFQSWQPRRGPHRLPTVSAALKTLAAWLPLFLVGLVLHESLHGLAVLLLGSQPELVVRPWAFSVLPLSWPSVHVAAVPPLDLNRQALDNALGPGLAALAFVAATALARGRA